MSREIQLGDQQRCKAQNGSGEGKVYGAPSFFFLQPIAIFTTTRNRIKIDEVFYSLLGFFNLKSNVIPLKKRIRN